MYSHIEYLDWNPIDNTYIYNLVDSDFEVQFVSDASGKIAAFSAMIVLVPFVIAEYDKRQLNVAANLACYFSQYNLNKILDQIKYVYPEIATKIEKEYLEDIKKYLLLI